MGCFSIFSPVPINPSARPVLVLMPACESALISQHINYQTGTPLALQPACFHKTAKHRDCAVAKPLEILAFQRGANRCCHLGGGGGAAEIRCRGLTRGECALDRLEQGGARIRFSQVIQHHGRAPEARDRVGDAFAGDVEAGAMNRLEHGGEFSLRVEVGGRRDAQAAR